MALALGRRLVCASEGWRLAVPGPETKTGRPLELPFPEALVPALERRLAVHRPVLAAQDRHGQAAAGVAAVWLSAAGWQLSAGTLAFHVTALTRAAFGRPVNPHLFRDCAATALAIEDSEHARVAAEVLGHITLVTTERHYNLTRGQEAAESWHETLEGLRRAGMRQGARRSVPGIPGGCRPPSVRKSRTASLPFGRYGHLSPPSMAGAAPGYARRCCCPPCALAGGSPLADSPLPPDS
jgi:hypothetical protein